MPTCVFKTDEVRRCVEHALNATAWSMGWEIPGQEQTPAPGLFLVHDQGVYLMSNAEPRDVVLKDGREHSYVTYAEHCNPDTDEDWWDNSRELVGGDDFAVVIPVSRTWLTKCGRYEELEVSLTGDEITWTFAKPRAVVRVM